MSFTSPTTVREVKCTGWVLAPFLIGPMALPLIFWWQVYVTFDAFMKVWPVAVPLGSVAGWLMHKRSLRLVALGLHPHFSSTRRVPRRNVFALFLGMILITWGWAVVLLALVVLSPEETQERSFTISKVKDCTRKCQGCSTQVEFSNWVGASRARFCARSLAPRPRVGEQLIIRGRFTDLVQYVREVERVRR
jgi:hypothetical protein